MKRALIPAFLLLLGSTILGATASASHVSPTVSDVSMASVAGVQSELSITVDPNDPNHLAAGVNDRPTPPGQRWYISTDGGRTWSNGQLPVQNLTVPGPDPFMSDPSLDFGSSGDVYYSALLHAGAPAACTLFVSVSRAGDGSDWSDPADGIVAAGSIPPAVCHDKEHIAIDRAHNDNVYIAWNPYGDENHYRVVFSRDLNGISDGLRFSAPTPLSDPSCRNIAPDLALAGDALYVAWTTFCPDLFTDGDGQLGTVHIAKSSTQGETWSTPVAVASLHKVDLAKFGLWSPPFASVDVDPVSGRVFVVYTTYAEPVGKTDADAMMVSSPDGSPGSWTSPVRVNQDFGTSDQWMPWVDVANGRVHVCYYTRAYDGGNLNYACSYGAVTASPSLTELRVSSASTPIASASRDVTGDYVGAFVGPDDVLHPAWGDGRVGVTGPSDAFTARVDFSRPTTAGLAPLAPSLVVGTAAHFTATVTGAHAEPEQFIPVTFAVTSSGFPSSTGGSVVTGPAGTAGFDFTNALPGTDTLHVFADLDEDRAEDPGERLDTTVTWLLPSSTDGAKASGSGTIVASGSGSASFSFAVLKKLSDASPKGSLEYSAPSRSVVATAISAIVINGNHASIFGTATVNGADSVAFRADIVDGGEPGSDDYFRMRLMGGYDSGLKPLTSGNVQTH